MTLGTTLSDTIKEEQAFSKISAERYARHAKGDDGVAEVEAFEREIQSIQATLAGLIEEKVPSKAVQVALKGQAFKMFERLSSSIIKPHDSSVRGEPLDSLVRNPMYGFAARSLRQWANAQDLNLAWRPANDHCESWWVVSALPGVKTTR